MIRIEVFVSPSCRRCLGTVRIVEKMVQDIGADRVEWCRVDVLERIDYAVALGVLATPAIAIDGGLVFTAAPSGKALRAAIERRMTEDPEERRSEDLEQ